ncbi:MAG TPA: (2Fe-2S)-binding protein [Thermoplasmata archaeon]|nr:(2Fe-2S)-binding protein [Thermoplasmata archaeon]
MTETSLALALNGRAQRRSDVPDDERLLDTLRWRFGLKGTKEGCRTGDCGACTVLVNDRAVLSCLTLAHEVDGERITTVEGLAEDAEGRAVRASFERSDAFQCGYCTPGFVVALAGSLKRRGGHAQETEILEDVANNLCRCTGYAAIRRAIHTLATEPR